MRCRACGHVYYVGLILWSPRPGGRHFGPEDTRPTAQQAASLRLQLNVWAKHKRPAGRLSDSLLGPRVNRLAELPFQVGREEEEVEVADSRAVSIDGPEDED